MKVLVSGSNGLIGSALLGALTAAGHYAVRLVRGEPDRARGDIVWDPAAARIERNRLEGMDAVIHLAGENTATLWTDTRKKRIYTSRVPATQFLCETLTSIAARPRTLLCASAIGYYGDRGDDCLDENSPAGTGFLAELCQDWERATEIAAHAGVRVANLRTGIVLSARGGALASMLRPFRTGFGGPLGSGRQYVSWIALEDVVGSILHLLEHETIRGPVNLTAPEPVTNREMTRALGRVLNRPAVLPVPAWILRRLPGGMGQEMFLNSARVEPVRLAQTGYRFVFKDIESNLHHAVSEI